jgi:quinol monooxygenase YgiN
MMHIIWRFRAKPDQVEHFRRVYARDGAWAKLFSHSPEYQGTILLQDASDSLLFVVIDRWSTSESFAGFRQRYGVEYELLDQQCLDLTDEEILIGHFTEMPA